MTTICFDTQTMIKYDVDRPPEESLWIYFHLGPQWKIK